MIPQMKPFSYYSKPQTFYPNKLDYVTYYVYDKGALLWSGPSYKKCKLNIKKEYPTALIQEILDEESFQNHKKEYYDEINRLKEEFQEDLFKEFGVSTNPKRHEAFNIAVKQKYEDNFEEIYYFFEDLVKLIKD
jgi:hypothetical protein